MRRYAFKNVKNMRDLGGFPLDLNKETAYGKFIRSDAPIEVSKEEMQFLIDLKVTTVIDLRSDMEVEENPCAYKSNSNFQYHHCPMFGNGVIPDKEEEVPLLYFDMADEKTKMKSVMKIIADSENGVLFHCTAGKDRTGVVAAIILSLVGVSMSDILADYEVTYCYIRETIGKLLMDDPRYPAFLGQSKIEYMERFFQLFLEKYGNTKNYLLEIGLNEDDINNIKSKLME